MNFALILFVLLVVTGMLDAVDVLKFRKLRTKGAKEPLWVEWGASFFPVILVVFVLRSFLFAVQNSFRLDDSDLIGWRFYLGQQVHLWHTLARDQQENYRYQLTKAWRCHGFSLS